ncbi:MAG: PD-(D/E)XK nuclease family protein [Candidatus Eisenbacteria bacterium]|nr:PD-(D/E)XK nuclease family protein [Candidatus Eisenbacteria bacterium]
MSPYSHSRLETYRQCPRKFHYRYVARVELPEEPEQIAAFLGSRVHEALEHLYTQVRKGPVVALRDLLDHYRRIWNEEWTDQVVIHDQGMTPDAYREIGERCLAGYYRRHHPFDQAITVDVEMRLRFPLDESAGHVMTGFIDRLARTPDGTWQIHDYKTANRLPTQAAQDRDTQLALYQIGLATMWKEVERVELVWHFLRFDTSIVSTRTPGQLEQVRAGTLATIADIESRGKSEAGFPPRESGLCDYCEFQALCPVRRHLVRVRALPPNEYLGEPGVRLVDRWDELRQELDALAGRGAELKEQVAKAKEALAAYAGENGAAAVTGTEREATVREIEAVLFPRKTVETEEADALEERLRRSPWWDLVSALDRRRLARLWKEGEDVDGELRRLLAGYVRTEKSVDVRLRTRKTK